MTFLTTLIVLAVMYGTGAVVCYTAETGTCRTVPSEPIEIPEVDIVK